MIFNDAFNVTLNFMCNFDADFKKEICLMRDFLPASILIKCENCQDFFEERRYGEYSLDLFKEQAGENRNLEFQFIDYETDVRYLLDISTFDEYDLAEIPTKDDKNNEVVTNFKNELGSMEFFGPEGYSLWEYTFEIVKEKDGTHLVMTKHVDDGTDRHMLIEERRVDKVINENDIIAFVNPKNLN